MTGWEDAASWWLDQVADDDIFLSDVVPLIQTLMDPTTTNDDSSSPWLDLGCGDGRVSRHLPRPWVSCDLSHTLLLRTDPATRPVRCRLPDLGWLRPASLDGAISVLVIEHLEDFTTLVGNVHRCVRPGGAFVVIMNHPAFTAEGSGPLIDVDSDEVLWRWGRYFDQHTADPGLGNDLLFFHRPLDYLLTTAATTGWALEQLVERGLSAAAVSNHPGYAGQEQIPRLLGVRWTRV